MAERKLNTLLLATILFVITAPALAQLVVIKSNSAEFKPGQIITDNLNLSANTGLTLISENGKIITINGPYQGSINTEPVTGDNSLISNLSALLLDTEDKARLAVFRKFKNHDTWTIRVDRDGHYCIHKDSQASLLRQRPYTETAMTIEGENNARATVYWQKTKPRTPWPAIYPTGKSAGFSMLFEDESMPVSVTLIAIPPELPSDPHRVVWMAQNGCEKQAQMLLDSLE